VLEERFDLLVIFWSKSYEFTIRCATLGHGAFAYWQFVVVELSRPRERAGNP